MDNGTPVLIEAANAGMTDLVGILIEKGFIPYHFARYFLRIGDTQDYAIR